MLTQTVLETITTETHQEWQARISKYYDLLDDQGVSIASEDCYGYNITDQADDDIDLTYM